MRDWEEDFELSVSYAEPAPAEDSLRYGETELDGNSVAVPVVLTVTPETAERGYRLELRYSGSPDFTDENGESDFMAFGAFRGDGRVYAERTITFWRSLLIPGLTYWNRWPGRLPIPVFLRKLRRNWSKRYGQKCSITQR